MCTWRAMERGGRWKGSRSRLAEPADGHRPLLVSTSSFGQGETSRYYCSICLFQHGVKGVAHGTDAAETQRPVRTVKDLRDARVPLTDHYNLRPHPAGNFCVLLALLLLLMLP